MHYTKKLRHGYFNPVRATLRKTKLQSKQIQVLLLDQNGFLSSDLEPMMPKETIQLSTVTSGLKGIEAIAGLDHKSEYPKYDIIIVPHEIDNGSGISVCRTIRRFYSADELIILAFIPPFLSETDLLKYHATEVDEVCTYPLSRIALQHKFKLLASLVHAHRRNQLMSKIQSSLSKTKNEMECYSLLGDLLSTDLHIQSSKIRTDRVDRSEFIQTNDNCYYSLTDDRLDMVLSSRNNVILAIKFYSIPDVQDINFLLSCYPFLFNVHHRETLDIKTVDGLSLLHNQEMDICAVKGANQYCEVMYKSGSTQLISNTPLKTIADHFQNSFTQCHRSWLVSNQLNWKGYHRGKGRYNLSADGHHIPIGDCYLTNLRSTKPLWFQINK